MMPIIGYENAFRKNRATAATAKSAATNKNKRTTTSRYQSSQVDCETDLLLRCQRELSDFAAVLRLENSPETRSAGDPVRPPTEEDGRTSYSPRTAADS